MNEKLLLAASLVLLIGCSAKSGTTLTHPNPAMLDSATVEKERQACRLEAQELPETFGAGDIDALTGLCMKDRGYVEVNQAGIPVGYVETDARGEPVESWGQSRDAAMTWFKPGATAETYRLAWKRCDTDAETIGAQNPSRIPKDYWIARCMKQNMGWTCLGSGCLRSKTF